MTDGDGKRDYVRVNDEFNVRLVREGGASGGEVIELGTSKAVNVSGSGLLVSTGRKLDAGETVSVTFMKPNTFDFFRGAGRVVRVEDEGDRSYRVAINFMELSPDDRNALNYYITLAKQ